MNNTILFKFNATVSDRGQIFIPKKIQEYLGILPRNKVSFIVGSDGRIIFHKKEEDDGKDRQV